MRPAAAVPPQSGDDEVRVIAEILSSPKALRSVIDTGLTPEMFYSEKLCRLFEAIRRVSGEGKHPDPGAAAAGLKSLGYGDFTQIQLEELALKSINPFAVDVPAERIIEAARWRKKLKGADLIRQAALCQEGDERRDELHREGMELVSAILSPTNDPTSAPDIAEAFKRHLRSPDPVEVFSLPFAELNETILGGLLRKEVSVLGAWPEHGKSWLVDQILTGLKEQGYRCAVFATEMNWLLRMTRFVTTRTQIPMRKILRKQLSPEELVRVEAAADESPYDHFNAAGMSEDEICERIILGGYDFAVIDVVNYVPGFVEKVAYAERICQKLLATAQRGNCHVLLVCHLNRARDDKATKPRPAKRDLKQTTALEQIAGTIAFLHRDESDKGEVEPGAELYFAKTRTGLPGSIRVFHDSRTLTFKPETGYGEDAEDLEDFFDRNGAGR